MILNGRFSAVKMQRYGVMCLFLLTQRIVYVPTYELNPAIIFLFIKILNGFYDIFN